MLSNECGAELISAKSVHVSTYGSEIATENPRFVPCCA